MTPTSDIADKLLDAAIGVESVQELPACARHGSFTIQGETVKWLADQMTPIHRGLMDLKQGLRDQAAATPA